MPRPTETLCALPTAVGYEAANEEQSPSPEAVHDNASMAIAIDGEGGIVFAERMMAQGGPARAGEGKPGYL